MTSARESKKARAQLDARLSNFRPELLAVPRSGWLRAIRNALGMSGADLAHRLGVTAPAVFELEKNERAGTIRLDSLRKAAEALDCTLVYGFVPKRGLAETVRARAEELANEELRHVGQTMALEDQAVPIQEESREELIQQIANSRGLWSRKS